MDIADRLAGGVFGHLVGDAVGVPYEFKTPREIGVVRFGATGTHGQPPGTWSDDGALMLALLDSLLRPRADGELAFDTDDQAERALAWDAQGHYTPDGNGRFDIGGATARAFARLRAGTPAEEAGGRGERDNGNGSLMRILPLALVERSAPDEQLVDMAHRASAVTHGHAMSKATCALYVLLMRRLLAGETPDDALSAASSSLREVYEGRPGAETFPATLGYIEEFERRSGSGFVVDSFWSAWDAFAGATDYRTTIERAVRYGNDTDTTACIAGGLAGVWFGWSGIPSDWFSGMRGRDIVDPLVARLIGASAVGAQASVAGARTSASHPLRVDWVDLASVPGLRDAPGGVGMTFAPGKHDRGQAGLHQRDLRADAQRLAEEHRVTRLVLLVEDHELADLGIADIVPVMADHGIEVQRFPITDMSVPSNEEDTRQLLADIANRVRGGERVVVACRGGLGRTGTIVACLLREHGLGADEAIALTRSTRRGALETAGQEAYVAAWKGR